HQETENRDEEGGNIFLTVRRSRDGREWEEAQQRIGPIRYSGTTEPFVFSAAVGPEETLFVAVTESAEETVIYRSSDFGDSFQTVNRVSTERTNVAPRIFQSSDGSMVLFVNTNIDGRQQSVYTHSPDGEVWSEERQLEPDNEVGLVFLPSMTSLDGRDYVVYQGINITERSTYQLYLRTSDDGGRTWEGGDRLTTFVDLSDTDDPDLYDNQRPDLVADPSGEQLLLAWERRFESGNPQVYLIGLNRNGERNELIEEVTGRFELARFPRIAFDAGEPVIAWFTNPRGNSRVVLGRRGGFRWSTQTLSPSGGEATFAQAISHRDRVHVMWQRRSGESGAQVVYAEPDQTADPPTILAGNFPPNGRSSASTAEFLLRDPADASGIRGYAWEWSRSDQPQVGEEIRQRVPDRQVVARADEDGPWFLHVRATDFAGNWSQPVTARFFRDTTPPPPVTFPPPSVDENGYLASNTFQVGWNPPEDEEFLAGYSVRLDYVGQNAVRSVDDPPIAPAGPMPQRVTTSSESIGRTNVDDGAWLLSVAPVDSVGNVGTPRTLPLRFNKYVPVTRVFATSLDRDLLGRYRVSVVGRGFESNGSIRQLVLDQQGTSPYDYEFNAWQGDFSVENDRRIGGLVLSDIPAGTYRLGLLHPERGMYIAPEPVRIDEVGVIKYGDFSPVFDPAMTMRDTGSYLADTWDVAFLIVVVAAAALILISAGRLIVIGGEIRRLNTEAHALITGQRPIPRKMQKERITRMKIRGGGLRLKFAFFVVLLVIGVVVLVAVVLGRNVLNRQEQILTDGLQQRIELLVDGQVTGARPALENPESNIDQLQNVATQGEAMAEALHVTITGIDQQGQLQTVFGTTDPAVISGDSQRIDTDSYVVGVSRLTDEASDEIAQLAQELNAQAQEELGQIPVELERLSQEAQELILQGATEAQIEQIDEQRSELLRRARERLGEIAGPIRSVPEFDFTSLRRDVTNFLFYKPVLDVVPGAGAGFEDFYRGTVRVAISTQLILDEIDSTQRDLLISTFLIAAAAVGFGVLGAYILATIVVRPINRLVQLVEKIGSTEDKLQLKGSALHLRTKDELSVLAESINDMVSGLVKAAEADKDLKFGKETQKAFIPLQAISEDAKRTFGEMRAENVYFFGYYEGAKGVSGDYFTYQKLSDRYYAMIKCDVAGKGIPAALIMVQVATVFQDYFRGWTPKSPGLDVSSLVLRINDIVAERQFKGRFAALTAGILDVQKGAFYLANAGDNQLHLYRGASKSVEQLTIPGGPAAGTFSSNDLPISFPQEMRTVARGDMLLLFTDGLEEAKRLLRGRDWKKFTVTQEMIDEGTVDERLSPDEDGEEFTIERVHTIVSAVESRATYKLEKIMDPSDRDNLLFDYSTCENIVRDTVLAVFAAERIFRLVPHPEAGPDDRIAIDRVVLDFLREHFVPFNEYFAHPVIPFSEDDGTSEYVSFSHLREDEQFDDLTMLAVARE
ncbi:MAG TPA: SpoIIE family protein phosphatase, partial [Alkalispirochaeta sp.]|nr:SpoIIE family protein phosphatase [Alkalispirochaeta sp.]